jgi:hypothetical protein
MTDRSARLALPYILPGQAQKEAYHNEALAALDALVHAAVEGPALATPPSAPQQGKCWIIAAGATGAWAGQQHKLACWTSGGWRIVVPISGMKVWDKAAAYWRYWTGSAWSDGRLPAAGYLVGGQQVVGPRLAALPSPSGGTTIDSEARAAIGAIIVALKSHGLTD